MPPPAARPDEYLFVTPVWGEVYVERYVKVCLPAQLSAGNLGAMPADRTRYVIYTLREHADTIRRSPAYRRLKKLVPTSLLSLDDLPHPSSNPNPHELQTAAYSRGIRAGHRRDTAYIFLTPDLLLSDGSCRNLVRMCEEDGRRVAMVASIRMCVDGAIACVDRHRTGTPGEVCIPPRELVRDCLHDIHPISAAHVMCEHGVKAAQHIYWQVGDAGMLVHGFHLFPLLVWPSVPNVHVKNTLDDDYVARACPDRADWHTVTDTDEVCVVEFSERHHKPGMVAPHYFTEVDLTRFVVTGTLPEHREMFTAPIHFHSAPLDPAEWEPVKAEAAKFVAYMLRLHADATAPKKLTPVAEAHAPTPAHVAALPPVPVTNVTPVSQPLAVADKPFMGRFQDVLADAIRRVPFLRSVLFPVRLLYRVVALPLYLFLDRQNAELIDLRNHVRQLRQERDRMADQLGRLIGAQRAEAVHGGKPKKRKAA